MQDQTLERSSMSTTPRYRAFDHVVSAHHDNAIVLLNVITERYYSVAGAGQYIWQLLCDGSTIDEIVVNLQERYGEPAERLRGDVLSLVRELTTASLIEQT